MLDIRILGRLEVIVDGSPVPLPRQKQRAPLALLVLRAGEVVSSDTLMDELWGGRPPATAKDALQNYVSQLRKTLGRETIKTRAPGYVRDVEPDEIDAGRFERLIAAARAIEDSGQRGATLREALALWRGPALADLAYEGFAATEAARLEELRSGVREDVIDAELAVGRHAELVAELEEIVERHPFDERARAQLMLALYRSGRQVEALDVYRVARQMLADELGLEPSPALRELERAILMQEPSLVSDEPEDAGEQHRKTVTVLSAELAPAEEPDPERLRATVVRAIAIARSAVEGHEGWVTTRAGDELLGVFGVPATHEDDALRAVRAALELRDALDADGLPVELRVGVETGEVLTGHGFVSGEVLRAAGRLQRSAAPGNVLLGESTLALVRHAVEGRRQHGHFRLASVAQAATAVARFADTPLVGRDAELELLRRRFDDACDEECAVLVTLAGEPGIGKSRLARELTALLDAEATVLTGRCVAYGGEVTFAPLREMVGTIDLEAAMAGADDAELVARRVAELVGLDEGTGSVDEGLWAVRRLFSALAAERPLVLVFEDLHWADEQLLDLVEQLADRATGPMLLVCAARPELLDARGRFVEGAISLEPLTADATHALAVAITNGEPPPAVVELAGGNPLFMEQLLAFAEEGGAGALETVPPTIDALLSARLDLLDPGVRGAAQRAALVGRDFSRAALAAIAPAGDLAPLSGYLLELVRRGLVHPRPAPAGDELYRFHHALVRDVAYAGLPKAARAELHETYGDWLDEVPDAPDEVVGYHLEQAYLYRTELGPPDRRAKQLALDAGTHLGDAGMRACKRADVPAAAGYLRRAVDLLSDDDELRRELQCELGVVLYARGETTNARDVLVKAVDDSIAARDLRIQLRSRVELAYVSLQHAPEGKAEELLALTQASLPMLEMSQDDRALARAWILTGAILGGHLCQNADWQHAAERALVHYRRTGFPPAACLGQIGAALYYGPTPVEQAISRCEELLAENHGRASQANVVRYLGGLVAMAGDTARGRALVQDAQAMFEGLGNVGAARACDFVRGDIEQLADDRPAAIRARTDLCEYCIQSEDFGALSTAAADLADASYLLAEYDEAEHWSTESERHAAVDDIGAQFAWRAVRAKVLARREEFSEAEALAHEALRLAEPTDALNKQANVQMSLAEVLRLAGHPERAVPAVEAALRLYEQKGNVVATDHARRALAHMAT